MKPGRELDALIDQVVFKHRIEWRDMSDYRYPVRVMGTDGSTEYEQVPHYSTDFCSALPILQKVGKDGLSYTYSGAEGHHEVIFFSTEFDDWAEEVVAESAPLAICMSALKVLKVKL